MSDYLCASQHNLPRNENKQHHFRFDHAVDQSGEELATAR